MQPCRRGTETSPAALPVGPPLRQRREVALSAAQAGATPQLHHRVIHWLHQLSLGRLSKFTPPSSVIKAILHQNGMRNRILFSYASLIVVVVDILSTVFIKQREARSAGIMRYWDLQLNPDIVQATEL